MKTPLSEAHARERIGRQICREIGVPEHEHWAAMSRSFYGQRLMMRLRLEEFLEAVLEAVKEFPVWRFMQKWIGRS